MDILEKFIRKVSYKFPKGYPDINNPEDKALLESIVQELTGNIQLNENTNTQYDQVIAYALFGDVKKVADIPKPEKKYQLGTDGSVDPDDMETWKKLYREKPPKTGREIGAPGTHGSGNGEIALYWLLNGSGYTVEDGRGDEQPDLIVNGTGLEVKAYGKRQITLGRFGKDYDTRKKLGYVLGLDVLISNLTGEERAPSIDSFNEKELVRGFETMAKFSANDNLREASKEFDLISGIYSKIDTLLSELELDQKFEPRDGAAAILRQLLYTKAAKKPGFGGYMVDVSEGGKIEYKQVTKEKLENLTSDEILKYVSAMGAALKIYPDELFG